MKSVKKIILIASVIICAVVILSLLFPEKLYNMAMEGERGKSGLVQKEITVGDHKIVYLEGGTGKETIVLVHGFGGSKDNWPKMVKYLPGYHFIIPDLPGFGESSKLETSKYDVASQVERMNGFFARLGLDNFYLAGNSMGGNISGIYAEKYPKKVKALILVNNAGVNAPVKSIVLKAILQGTNPLIVNTVDDYDNLLNLIFVKKPYIPYPIKRVLAEKSIESREFNAKVFRDFSSTPAMLEGNFEALTMPVLIIWGDTDRLIDVSTVSVLEKGIKNHTARILKDCGHVPMMERPEETAGYIKDFLETVK